MIYSEEEALRFKLENLSFEGPLDLLLALVNKNKMEIKDIQISLLFDQYMEYIEKMQEMDMDVAGEFLEMASRLMLIKSKMLLPRDSEDEKDDPRRELIDALLEYRKAKENAALLLPRYVRYHGRMIKETEEIGVDKTYVCDQDCLILMEAFERIMLRAKVNAQAMTDVPQKTLNTILTKRITPVPVKYFGILKYLCRNGDTDFEKLLMTFCHSKSDLIASFMAILQLIRSQYVRITDENDGNPIFEAVRKEERANG